LPIFWKTAGERIILLGQTFPHKEAIKALGGRFNGADKTWWVPLNMESSVAALCEKTGGGPAADPTPHKAAPETFASPASGADDAPPWRTTPDDNGGAGTQARAALSSSPTDGLSVSALMELAHRAVSQAFPLPLWVIGEVQGKSLRSGHIFFQLADAKENSSSVGTVTVKATLWAATLRWLVERHGASRIDDVLQDGIRVRMLVRVQLFRDRGQLSLSVEDIDPAWTKGELALAREALLRELRAKGLDQANKRLVLPAFALRIGLISAPGSRAETDFLHQLATGNNPAQIVFWPCSMQGEMVPRDVALAVEGLSAAGCDLIVITRGGGSAADLRWFDAPQVAMSIATCKVPVLAAIGHHEDVCVAEEIAWRREKTPTAAAQFILDWFAQLRQRLDRLLGVCADQLDRRLHETTEIQRSLAPRLHLAATAALGQRDQGLAQLAWTLTRLASEQISRQELSLTHLAGGLHQTATSALSRVAEQISGWALAMARHDPKPWMAAGWTRLQIGTTLIERASDIKTGDHLTARMLDAVVALTVTDVSPHSKNDRTQKNTPS
jgi:exodeoxyribonuclease VII large subunit